MRKTGRIMVLVVLMMAMLMVTAFAMPEVAPTAEHSKNMLAQLHGTWNGVFSVQVGDSLYTNDTVTINVVNGEEPKLYLTVLTNDSNYIEPKSWSTENGTLTFTYNNAPWTSVVTLDLQDGKTLKGTYQQYGGWTDVTLKKTSATPVDFAGQPNFIIEEQGDKESLKLLQENKKYGGWGDIPYAYEMNNKAPLKAFIKSYGLDELMAGKTTDEERMLTLLNFVCDNFRHDGASGMPEKQDTLSVVNYCKVRGGIECRGLAIILSDLCRAYGIPAKSIKGGPSVKESNSCHVVVHAYSAELGQWVMLDPTYRLVLKNEAGQYLSLPMLRDCLINEDPIIPNQTAGRNRRPFYMDFYRAYMTANTFHFTTQTSFYYGSEAEKENKTITLVPAGYSTGYAYYHYATPTNSADEFWKAP